MAIFHRDVRYLRCLGRKRKEPKTAFGEYLTYLRYQKGMTQDDVKRELAHKVGWSTESSVIADWEGGKLPGRNVIIALAEIYDVSIETLLGVQRLPNGQYIKNEQLMEQAKRANEARRKSIKEKNHDPML